MIIKTQKGPYTFVQYTTTADKSTCTVLYECVLSAADLAHVQYHTLYPYHTVSSWAVAGGTAKRHPIFLFIFVKTFLI